MESEIINRLQNENLELKKVLSFLLNESLVNNLIESLNRINAGDYVNEEEFFMNSL